MAHKAPDDRRAVELVVVPPPSVDWDHATPPERVLHGAIAKVMKTPAALFTEAAG